jgi:hypothetical protein
MTRRHLICLTIDTDPDGLAGRSYNRDSLTWNALEGIQPFLDGVRNLRPWGPLPITWFIRADAQLQTVFGSATYLLERFERRWTEASEAGDELGWHPHLYRQAAATSPAALITDPPEAADELRRLWSTLSTAFPTDAFRNGEGWHSGEMFDLIEEFGFRTDSTAIPGRIGTNGHPMNWIGTPNHPYFPDASDIRRAGRRRPLLEIPMTTWLVKAPYDREPRLRYINPAIHAQMFSQAVEEFAKLTAGDLNVWTMILHADEVFDGVEPDGLYGRSARVAAQNIARFAEAIADAGGEVRFTTLSQASEQWAQQEKANDLRR